MEKENEYLKEKIVFLEAMLEINGKTLEKSITTNQVLMDFLRNCFQK